MEFCEAHHEVFPIGTKCPSCHPRPRKNTPCPTCTELRRELKQNQIFAGRMLALLSDYRECGESPLTTIDRIVHDRDRLRTALEWYARKDNYLRTGGLNWVEADGGIIAREALSPEPTSGEESA